MAHKIIQWNWRGLRSNYNDLAILLLEHSPSAVCLQETNLKPGGGVGVTSAWSPLGNFIEGQAHPNVLLILCFSHVITYGSRVFCITFQSILNGFGGKYRA